MKRRAFLDRRLRRLSLEIVLCAGIVGALVAACLQDVAPLGVKARLVTVFIGLTAERRDSLEAFATTGSWPRAADAKPAFGQDATQISYDFQPAGAGLLARGHVGKDAQPFAISFVPAASDDGGAHVRWLCGLRRAPAGWTAASAPRVLELPHGASYDLCRDDGEGA